MSKATPFSQPTGTNVGLGSNPVNPCPSAKKTPHGKHGGRYGLPLHPSLTGDEISFILSASKMELRHRYIPEANSHRNRKAQAKGNFSAELRDFRDFLLYVGLMPQPGMTLDRINNDDPQYAWDKVRWATKKVQNNNKSDTGTYTCSKTGKTFTTSELAQLQGVCLDTIRKRSKRGWTADQIIAGKKPKPAPTSPKVKSQSYIPALSVKNLHANFIAFSVPPLWGYPRLDFPAGIYTAKQRHRICHPTMEDHRFSQEARYYQHERQYGDGEHIPMTKGDLIRSLMEGGDGHLVGDLEDDGDERHFVRVVTRNRHFYFPNLPQPLREIVRDHDREWVEKMEQRFHKLELQRGVEAKAVAALKDQLGDQM